MLEIKNLTKHFPINKSQTVYALDGVSFSVGKGRTLGIVGESGCGKSTCARTIMRIYEPTSGEIIVNGNNIESLSNKKLKPLRKDMQMIFQDPYASLNARMTVYDIIAEPLIAHNMYKTKAERDDVIYHMINKVGLTKEHANRYAHEFSGGQRQRIGISRALILNPSIIVCDEPISALDVSIQAQVINLLKDLQEELSLTYLFIAHDLSMVRYISDDVGVMYLGNLVEICDSDELYTNPLHPYTKGLLNAIPAETPALARIKPESSIRGDLPSPINPPSGCRFHTRCENSMDICSSEIPILKDVGNNHKVACHLYK